MATTLDILVVPTYNKTTLAILDNSTYDIPIVNPTISVTMPTFDPVDIVFAENTTNVFDSEDLGLTGVGEDLIALPDGVYKFNYHIDPEATYYVEKYFMRTEQIQETFDAAFMKLDMMECDKAIKKQAKVDLNTIYFFIQGAIAAANNCAIYESTKLYVQAAKMLNSFLKNNCGCSGSNYVINFS